MVILEDEATERSSYAITLSNWTDAIGQTVTPDSLTWTLTTVNGTVINERSAVSVTPASTVIIVLSNNDLAFQTGESAQTRQLRVLTIEGEYDSSLGSNLSLREEYRFALRPLTIIT